MTMIDHDIECSKASFEGSPWLGHSVMAGCAF